MGRLLGRQLPRLAARRHTVADAATHHGGTLNLSGGGTEPERLQAAWVSANFFKVVGIRPLAGRPFAPGEDDARASRVAVISEKLWRRRFGADPAVLGRSLSLNGEPYSLVGILRQGIQLPGAADISGAVHAATRGHQGPRRGIYFGTVARLRARRHALPGADGDGRDPGGGSPSSSRRRTSSAR